MTKKLFALLFGLVILSTSSLSFADQSSCNQGNNKNEEFNATIGTCVCQPEHKRVAGICEPCDKEGVCCGVKLNTNVPFIGNCIALKSQDPTSGITEANAFPMLMAGLTKILMTVILIVCFLVIIVAGVLWTTGDSKKGRELIKGVAIALALLGASGVILRLVNPNFFG